MSLSRSRPSFTLLAMSILEIRFLMTDVVLVSLSSRVQWTWVLLKCHMINYMQTKCQTALALSRMPWYHVFTFSLSLGEVTLCLGMT